MSIATTSIKLKSEEKTPIESKEFRSVKIKLLVSKARQRDFGKAIARINQTSMLRLGINAGDIIEIAGSKITVAAAWPAYSEDQDKEIIRSDEVTRKKCWCGH